MPFDWISLTTDYGLDGGFVAACRGTMARIAPKVGIIDVAHGVPPQDVLRGAAVLAQTVAYLPPSVHFAVVDPGVGTPRRGLAVVTPNGPLVGPDNGLLVPAAEVLGGIEAAYELNNAEYWLPTVSNTFHGRDIFAPVAAHLAIGVPADKLGSAVETDSLVRLPTPETRLHSDRVDTEVLAVDRFGNVQLAASPADLASVDLHPHSRVRLRLGAVTAEATLGSTFNDVPSGALLAYVDSAGLVAVAVNGGSASARLGLAPGARVELQNAGGSA
jgi:S-adenosyl-L-methionine hydrolase (adenosine-forming)